MKPPYSLIFMDFSTFSVFSLIYRHRRIHIQIGIEIEKGVFHLPPIPVLIYQRNQQKGQSDSAQRIIV